MHLVMANNLGRRVGSNYIGHRAATRGEISDRYSYRVGGDITFAFEIHFKRISF